MSTFNLTITLGNEAMQTPSDVGYALEELGRKLQEEHSLTASESGTIMDDNGNRVGNWEVSA